MEKNLTNGDSVSKPATKDDINFVICGGQIIPDEKNRKLVIPPEASTKISRQLFELDMEIQAYDNENVQQIEGR